MSHDGAAPTSHPGVELWCDLLCPDCAAFLDDLDQLQQRVQVRFRHFPLVKHIWAVPAAQVCQEARVQGLEWPVVKAILASVGEISSPDDLVTAARRGGASAVAVRRALADGRHGAAVARDYREGRALGVTGTPTLVVQGPGGPVLLSGASDQTGLLVAALALLEAFDELA